LLGKYPRGKIQGNAHFRLAHRAVNRLISWLLQCLTHAIRLVTRFAPGFHEGSERKGDNYQQTCNKSNGNALDGWRDQAFRLVGQYVR